MDKKNISKQEFEHFIEENNRWFIVDKLLLDTDLFMWEYALGDFVHRERYKKLALHTLLTGAANGKSHDEIVTQVVQSCISELAHEAEPCNTLNCKKTIKGILQGRSLNAQAWQELQREFDNFFLNKELHENLPASEAQRPRAKL